MPDAFADTDAAYLAARPADGWRVPVEPSTVKQAQADFGCRRSTHLLETQASLNQTATQGWLDLHPAYLAQLHSEAASVLKRAAELQTG